MFETRKFRDKNQQADTIWGSYLDILVVVPDPGIDYPGKIKKLIELIEYAERELTPQVHSYNESEGLPRLKDKWLGHFYKHLSRLYSYNQSVEKATEAMTRAKILYPGIEEL